MTGPRRIDPVGGSSDNASVTWRLPNPANPHLVKQMIHSAEKVLVSAATVAASVAAQPMNGPMNE